MGCLDLDLGHLFSPLDELVVHMVQLRLFCFLTFLLPQAAVAYAHITSYSQVYLDKCQNLHRAPFNLVTQQWYSIQNLENSIACLQKQSLQRHAMLSQCSVESEIYRCFLLQVDIMQHLRESSFHAVLSSDYLFIRDCDQWQQCAFLAYKSVVPVTFFIVFAQRMFSTLGIQYLH